MSQGDRLSRIVFLLLLLAPAAACAADDAAVERDRTAFAHDLERAVNARDAAFVDAALDREVLIDRALRGLTLSKGTEAEIRAGIAGNLAIGKAICGGLGDGGTYKFLRLVRADGEQAAVFRSVVGERFTYHELTLAGGGDRPVRIADVYGYLGGEKTSATWRRLVLPVAAEKDKGFLEKLVGKENEFVANAPKLMSMQQAFQSGRFAEALATYGSMPQSMREEKMVLLMRLRAAEQVGEKEHAAALEDIVRLFGDDPAMSLALLFAFAARRDYPKALAAVDRIEKGVGGDPYLHLQRTAIFRLTGRREAARAEAEKALAEEPTLGSAYWQLIQLALEEKRWSDVTGLLSALEKQGAQIPDLSREPSFAEFVKSKDYEAWIGTRGGAAPRGGAAADEWPELTSKEQTFAARFPARPETQRQQTGTFIVNQFGAERGGAAFVVTVVDLYAAPGATLDTDVLLEKACGAMIVDSGGKLVGEMKAISLAGAPGRAFEIETGADLMSLRVYMVKQARRHRQYSLFVGGEKGKVAAADAARFFDSFRVLPE